ncbi:hypothetical protein AYL99_04482 [Fonsecaea erecta]|uniref:Uncharacterized protein n=1 Tax=Fonsecaea erecta TaxID=1367422 RepID=A0A178ZR22_9EURO|nr:hypothetical protein AYL99_04482 [Fonsecaea erecta]OAP62279.1 hypothetical protein AYL99_04482 [Fonsecaea erecta]
MATNTSQLFIKGGNWTSAVKQHTLSLTPGQHKPKQAISKQAASPKLNKVVKHKLPGRHEKASLFHKPQKRGPLAAIAAPKLNALNNDNEKLFDLVTPSANMRPHKDIYTVPSARGHGPRTVAKIMAVPKFLIAPREIDNSASKALLELIEQAKAEKQRQKEIDALFESDSEN